MPKFNDTTIYGDLTITGDIKGSYTKGDILYASEANKLTILPAGSNGQVLKLANGIPSWDTDNNETYTAGDGLTLTNNIFAPNTSYTSSGKNYKVQVDSASKGLYVNVPWENINTYPTTFTWDYGYTEGPTGTLTGTSQTVYFGPIPSANDYQSGVVTAADQTFAGTKTFMNTISGSITGNAGSATKLATARTIGGVSFDGTANINLPGVNTAGTQNTTGNAGSATKLATARTIFGQSFNGTGNVTGNITFGTQSNKATIAYTTNTARTFTIPNTTSNAEFVMGLSWSTATGELVLA